MIVGLDSITTNLQPGIKIVKGPNWPKLETAFNVQTALRIFGDMQVSKPDWNLFDRLVAEAKTTLVICSPWISTAGLEHLQPLLSNGNSLKQLLILARMADMTTDAPAILQLAQSLKSAGITTQIYDSPVLHAKIYLADRRLAMVTSANLSEGGFCNNLEAAVLISDSVGITQVVTLLNDILSETNLVSFHDLEHFVKDERPKIAEQSLPQAPVQIVPVWRRQAKGVHGGQLRPDGLSQVLLKTPLSRPNLSDINPTELDSKEVDLLDAIKWVKASLLAAQERIQHINLHDFVGTSVIIWTCPCYILKESPCILPSRL